MVPCAVVTFAVVFPDELPVALYNEHHPDGDLRLGEAVRREIRRQMRSDPREVRRGFCNANKDIAGDRLAMNGLETESRRVEPLAHIARIPKPPVQFVAPLVVWTNELAHLSFLG